MKVIIILIVCIMVSFAAFLFLRHEDINLEGSWKATRIVINGKDLLLSDPINKYFDVGDQIIISNWGHSINLSIDGREIVAGFVIDNYEKDKNHVILTSRERALNGNFNMEVDTIDLGPQAYRVNVRLELNRTYLYFQREVIVPPWKPEFPRKGRV